MRASSPRHLRVTGINEGSTYKMFSSPQKEGIRAVFIWDFLLFHTVPMALVPQATSRQQDTVIMCYFLHLGSSYAGYTRPHRDMAVSVTPFASGISGTHLLLQFSFTASRFWLNLDFLQPFLKCKVSDFAKVTQQAHGRE
ncbi:hypothetical protein DV515_00003295 [Chloebia gouldiae]|uniref:Uncharacterized protein n=1 Tax=Chloebia gouldiae TaxID=44316 RepID=A0A3L8SWF8_CHLGU|nr:hypothetical protein DV515_00003295 [Chloebia gouldiae]